MCNLAQARTVEAHAAAEAAKDVAAESRFERAILADVRALIDPHFKRDKDSAWAEGPRRFTQPQWKSGGGANCVGQAAPRVPGYPYPPPQPADGQVRAAITRAFP